VQVLDSSNAIYRLLAIRGSRRITQAVRRAGCSASTGDRQNAREEHDGVLTCHSAYPRAMMYPKDWNGGRRAGADEERMGPHDHGAGAVEVAWTSIGAMCWAGCVAQD